MDGHTLKIILIEVKAEEDHCQCFVAKNFSFDVLTVETKRLVLKR